MFWPGPQQDASVGHHLTVHLSSSAPDGAALDFALRSDGNQSLSVRMVFCPHWPRVASSSSNGLGAAVEFLSSVRAAAGATSATRLAVVDALGGTEAATFCALLALADQLEAEKRADVYG